MEMEERGGERNLGDESAKGVGKGEDGGWGVGWWVGRREKMDLCHDNYILS